ncbi:MAG: response regulator [Candidatus Sericytochromatia bacterium]|uniref:Response regulator n=1 Tax=Candidatus Tanganyikabacteria bacterium TaxID=2961651 RepID=A0A938BM46_9BACT|nr:response regulator [Candidatus Tanganyikabacteria bacterium]
MASILIADDSSFMRLMLREILTRMGHTIAGEACDGNEVLELYDVANPPDLVTMDITMPRMDGIEALRKLQNLHPPSRVIVCSAQGKDEIIRECLSSGARAFIVKPFQAEQVAQAIDRVLSSS